MSMKLQAAAVLCVVLLVASDMVATTTWAAGCDIMQLEPCIPASKDAKVMPSKQCCSNVASMGKGLAGAQCLCSLLSDPRVKAFGVDLRIAVTIPQKCHIPVPRGFVCQGIPVPGG